ncbi:MAG: CRISPR-associated DxTHG motif protein [Candidatus Odinarchaeota archaeon]
MLITHSLNFLNVLFLVES